MTNSSSLSLLSCQRRSMRVARTCVATSFVGAAGACGTTGGGGTNCRVAVAVPLGPRAVMMTGTGLLTGEVLTGKVMLVEPDGTTTVAATTARIGLLLARLMTSPPGPAGRDNSTCPTTCWPPTTGFGESS